MRRRSCCRKTQRRSIPSALWWTLTPRRTSPLSEPGSPCCRKQASAAPPCAGVQSALSGCQSGAFFRFLHFSLPALLRLAACQRHQRRGAAAVPLAARRRRSEAGCACGGSRAQATASLLPQNAVEQRRSEQRPALPRLLKRAQAAQGVTAARSMVRRLPCLRPVLLSRNLLAATHVQQPITVGTGGAGVRCRSLENVRARALSFAALRNPGRRRRRRPHDDSGLLNTISLRSTPTRTRPPGR